MLLLLFCLHSFYNRYQICRIYGISYPLNGSFQMMFFHPGPKGYVFLHIAYDLEKQMWHVFDPVLEKNEAVKVLIRKINLIYDFSVLN